MSTFDDASLVFIPSGYKTSKAYSVKPTDGSGDLAFTRSNDTATRVGPDGLIEKVRTNLILQSEDFTTSWSPNAAPTITANTTVAPDGTTTADTIASSGASSGAYQVPTVASGVEYSFSVYVKNITSATNIQIGCDLTPSNGTLNFNAVTGAITVISAGVTGSSVTSVGNGWYRVSGTYVSTGTTNTFIVFGQSGMSFAVWGAQLEAGVTTDYIVTTTAAVSVGPVANVPRLDYLGSSCPRLLLEPQRVNLALFSESFDNAAWTKQNGSVTANTTVSPDGYTNADTFTSDSTTGEHNAYSTTPITILSSAFTTSCYVKPLTGRYFCLSNYQAGQNYSAYATFDLQTGTTVATGAIFGTYISNSIQSVGNGWYRVSVTGSGVTSNYVALNAMTAANFNPSVNTEGQGQSYAIYGVQLEQGDYATSYIPTLGAAVTRGADAASKTGISSLIGTEFTLFYDGFESIGGDYNRYIALKGTGGTYANFIVFESNPNHKIAASVSNSSEGVVFSALSNTLTNGQRVKLALRCKNNSFAFYVNGSLVASQASGTVPTTSTLYLGYYVDYSDSYNLVNQSIIFPTGLTNAQLAELTTI